MSAPPLEEIYSQPSWPIKSNRVEAWLTPTGGHLGPIKFQLGDRVIQPFNIAPWHDELLDGDFPPILSVLRGDFFCMPFGANDSAFEGEHHPPHGETANGQWAVDSGQWAVHNGQWAVDNGQSLTVGIDLAVRPGRVEKTIALRDDETVVYQKHRISGFGGPMTYGHHAMLKFPDREGAGLISTSAFSFAATAPLPVELPENRGYSLLDPDRTFEQFDRVPTITGDEIDLSRYPARKGFEDLVMLVSKPNNPFAWSAVSFPDEGYVWFALKNPASLPNTVLWFSNRGRYYAPWNGRHECVLGFEEVNSYFHYGLAESVAPNPVSDLGHPTFREFEPTATYEIPYIMGVADVPIGFGRVERIEPAGDASVVIRDADGASIEAPVDWSFVRVDAH